jgi:hypothetical protein
MSNIRQIERIVRELEEAGYIVYQVLPSAGLTTELQERDIPWYV